MKRFDWKSEIPRDLMQRALKAYSVSIKRNSRRLTKITNVELLARFAMNEQKCKPSPALPREEK